MKVSVQLFARAQELAGADLVEIDLPDESSVAGLRQALAEQVPAIASLVPGLFVSVGCDYADDSTLLEPDQEIACFPPVSGG